MNTACQTTEDLNNAAYGTMQQAGLSEDYYSMYISGSAHDFLMQSIQAEFLDADFLI
jgi:hypothetical protein